MPLLPVAYTAIVAELLYAHSGEMAGLFDLDLGWFTHVNPAGVQLLAYTSEEEFLADPNHSLRTPPGRMSSGSSCATSPGTRATTSWKPISAATSAHRSALT